MIRIKNKGGNMKREGLIIVVVLFVFSLVMCAPLVMRGNVEGGTPFTYDKATTLTQLTKLYDIANSSGETSEVLASLSNQLMKYSLSMPATIYLKVDKDLSNYDNDDETRLLFTKLTILLFKTNITLIK